MLYRLRILLAFSLVVAVVSCGDVHEPELVTVVEPSTTTTVLPVTTTTIDRAGLERDALEWISAVVEFAEAVSVPPEPRTAGTAPASVDIADAITAEDPLAPCGGDLPPCWVAKKESGGSYTAYNPTGCGGRGCFGKWQFSGEWACRLGLPCDLSTATPEQQDNAARELWAGGRGCSNWAAC